MCEFFSCISDGKGKMYYFDYVIRKKILTNKLTDSNGNSITQTDSHSSISSYYALDDDKVNKYEYKPLNKRFTVDQLNTKDDSKSVEKQCRKIDFSKIVPELILKEIFNPQKRVHTKVEKKHIALLKKWDSVGASVWASVRASVRASVWDSVGDSVWASVRDSVWDSVRDSVRDSVGASVWAYISSFYKINKWKYIKHKIGENPFQPCIDLWHDGLVPSFDGETWRLHTGKKAKIVYEWKKEG